MLLVEVLEEIYYFLHFSEIFSVFFMSEKHHYNLSYTLEMTDACYLQASAYYHLGVWLY